MEHELEGGAATTVISAATASSGNGSAYGGRDGLQLDADGVVRDAQRKKVGELRRVKWFSAPFWRHLARGFHSLKDSALFEHAQPRELHVALSSVGELFVLAGSLIAGFSLSLLQVVDVKSLGPGWYFSILLFVTLSFVSGIAAVIIAAMIFLGVSTTPVSHVNLFAAHLGSWILRPGFLLCASFVFLGIAFALVAMLGPFRTASIICVTLVSICFLFIVVAASILLVEVVSIRDFVEDDVRKVRESQKRARVVAKKRKHTVSRSAPEHEKQKFATADQ
mmetsp:Transcript_8466/g.22285  ORF Transcript_8466/g.22285 Transcript_8466/m.22285 type:complete len:279 (+) Transcript_8466:209-1045(+)